MIRSATKEDGQGDCSAGLSYFKRYGVTNFRRSLRRTND